MYAVIYKDLVNENKFHYRASDVDCFGLQTTLLSPRRTLKSVYFPVCSTTPVYP